MLVYTSLDVASGHFKGKIDQEDLVKIHSYHISIVIAFSTSPLRLELPRGTPWR